MAKIDLMTAVFERFEERRKDILEKHRRFQAELNQDLDQLREAYGEAALNGLGELRLTIDSVIAQTPGSSTKTSATQPRSQSKRRRQRSKGAPSVRSLLAQKVPDLVEALLASQDEFVARDMHTLLRDSHKLDVPYGSVSLFLAQNTKQLGLTSEKRRVGTTPRPTNFYRRVKSQIGTRKKAAKKVGRPAGKSRVDWPGHIIEALKGLRRGLTMPQLKERLNKRGVPAEKFKGSGFSQALARLVHDGSVSAQNNRYKI